MKIKRTLTISTFFLLICLMFYSPCAVSKNIRHHKKGSSESQNMKKDKLRRLQTESQIEPLSVPTPDRLEEVRKSEPELAPESSTEGKTSTSSVSENTKSGDKDTLDGQKS